MKTFFTVCSGLGSIFQIFPLTVNQRPETVTLLSLGLVYLFICFLCKVSIHHLLRLFYGCILLKRKTFDVFGKFLLRFYIQFTLMEIDSDL